MFMLQLRLCGCWTVLNLMQSHFSKGRQGGHRFNLGRGVCGVQVLLQNSLFWNWEASDDPLFNTGILRWVQDSGSSPTPSGKRVLHQNASCHLVLQHHHWESFQQDGHPRTDRAAGHRGGPNLHCQGLPHQGRQSQGMYSLEHLVVPKLEELISRTLLGLFKIRLLFQDRVRSQNVRF